MAALLAELEAGRGRGRRWPLALGAAAVGATALWIGWPTAAPDACADVPDALDSVWGEPSRQAVADALQRADAVSSEETVVRVVERLDRYAAQWKALRREVCRAERDPADGDLQRACLQRRRSALASVVQLLRDADQTVARNAVPAVAGLPPIRDCADLPALRTGLAAPADPEAVAEARARLDRATALRVAGHFDEAVALAGAMRQGATAAGYAPLSAEVALEHGRALLEAGRDPEAVDALEAAYFEAQRVGHDVIAAEAAAQLTYVVGYRLARHADGRAWGEHALAAARRVGEGSVVEADVRHNLGAVHNALGRVDRAEQEYRRAYELRRALLDEDDPELASSLNALGNVHLVRAEYPQALARYREALVLRERVFGPSHPEVAAALNNIAITLRRSGDLSGARDALQRAIALYERAHGPLHRDVAQARNNLGLVLRDLGDLEGAIREHERSLQIRTEVQGSDHPDVGDALVGLGRALCEQGRCEEAQTHLMRALDLYERGFGPEHPVLGTARLGLAIARAELGRTDEAIADAEATLSLFADTPNATEYRQAQALLTHLRGAGE